MLIRDLFLSDVTRDIPPVVYFHEQSPEKLAAEISEYIVTGGWPEDHPNRRRVPSGIHEQYVHLLTNIAAELDKPGGPELPTAWISGFYGSGKSSFAKLLGLALDGVALPDGTSLVEAWLRRNTSPRAAELREAWKVLRQKIDPLAVVFDIGSVARDNEQIHAAVIRQVQRRLGYCSTDPLVADFELRLERDGQWPRFEEVARETLGKPWSELKDKAMAEEDFSVVMSVMFPDRYPEPMAWYTSRAGTHTRSEAPQEAVTAIRDMLQHRKPGATLFLVVDEVSQYILSNKDRADRLRAFATALGASLRGKAWLLALGQQRLEEDADDSFLVWVKDRFPPKLRVHLAVTNIRDVVHKRLLQKKPEAEAQLRELFERHRPDLKLHAYGCEAVTPEEFIEVYPMLPGQFDLILRITSALRTRSARAQGDDQAIRGLLQLLGELFRSQRLAEQPIGALVTLDQIYEVQHTALDSDVQGSMARVLSHCTGDADALMVRAAKAVALLELIQETEPTDAKLVAQCLYDRVDRGNHLQAVTEALEELRRRNLLGYSEKHGYKLQSSAGEEWERERRDIPAPRELLSKLVSKELGFLLATSDRPRLHSRPFPWTAYYSDGRRTADELVTDARDEAACQVDFRFLAVEDRLESTWIRRSAETALEERLLWLCGDTQQVEEVARDLHRSQEMAKRYKGRRESLTAARKLLLQVEENRAEDLERRLRDVMALAWQAGRMYYRGRALDPRDHGATFGQALQAAAQRLLPDMYPHFIATQVQPAELLQLVEPELSGPSPKFLSSELGILELDNGRYVPVCSGVVPSRVQAHIEAEGGISGAALLAHFGGPPFGYTANVVKACVAGLIRASKLRVLLEEGAEITAFRDAGVRDLFEKERAFRRATFFPAGEDDIGVPARSRICKFFEERLGHPMDREDHAIADAVMHHFPLLAQKLRGVQAQLAKLPGGHEGPPVFKKLGEALENCMRVCRQTHPTVKQVKARLDTLQDGVQLLNLHEAELTPEAVEAVRRAHDVMTHRVAQLRAQGVEPSNVEAAASRVAAHLATERPWQDIGALADDLDEIRSCYVAERQRLLAWQEQQAEAVRVRLRGRDGFSTLTADEAHSVLRPLQTVVTNTTPEAIAPELVALKDPFAFRLQQAEDEANQLLDEVLSRDEKKLVTTLDLRLRNREVASEKEVDALLEDIRERLLEHVQAGTRVRLL